MGNLHYKDVYFLYFKSITKISENVNRGEVNSAFRIPNYYAPFSGAQTVDPMLATIINAIASH